MAAIDSSSTSPSGSDQQSLHHVHPEHHSESQSIPSNYNYVYLPPPKPLSASNIPVPHEVIFPAAQQVQQLQQTAQPSPNFNDNQQDTLPLSTAIPIIILIALVVLASLGILGYIAHQTYKSRKLEHEESTRWNARTPEIDDEPLPVYVPKHQDDGLGFQTTVIPRRVDSLDVPRRDGLEEGEGWSWWATPRRDSLNQLAFTV